MDDLSAAPIFVLSPNSRILFGMSLHTTTTHKSTDNTHACMHNSVLLLNTFAITFDPLSLSSLHHLRSSKQHDLFMLHVRTTIAPTRSFASIGPSLWNHFPPHFCSLILSAPFSLSLSL